MLHSPVKTVCSCRPLPFSIPGREQSGANPPQSRINPGFFKTFRTLPQQHLFNEFYARDTSKKIRAVKQAKAQRGERVNGEAPYGYLIDPENKNHLIPDPETAHVVKQIFAMYVRGDRMCDIQNWLRDNEILTVGELRYRRTGRTQHPRPQLNAWYNWPDKTLYDILTRQEYLGHTITAKTYKVSYKSKKTRKNAEDKRYFFLL